MQKQFIVPLVIGALVLAGGSFYGGMRYQKMQTVSAQGSFQRGQGLGRGGVAGGGVGRMGMNGAAGSFISGEVISKDASGLTLKLRDGGSKIILTSTSTRVGKMTDGSLDDLANGTDVTVTGTTNPDGSLSASMIQLRPAGSPTMGGMRPGGERTQ